MSLVLETLYFGFLFYNVYKVLLAILVVLLAGQWAILPFVKRIISHTDEAKGD